MQPFLHFMKYAIKLRNHRIFTAALVGLFSGCAWGQIQLVNVTSCGAGAFPGTTCTIPATGSGHLIVVGWLGVTGSTTTISGITDNVGNVYTEAGAARATRDVDNTTVVDMWYAKNSNSGATSIAINPSASVQTAGAVIWEFSGADTSAPFDSAAVLNSQPATATPTGAAVTTAAANEVIVSIGEVNYTVTGIASGSPFTNDSLVLANGWAHLITSSAGTYAAQWNESPAGSYASSTAAFKAAVATSSTTGTGGTTSASGVSACDLNADGAVNSTDVNLAVNMALGSTTCAANVEGADVCTVITVQRVVNASDGQTCITYNSHGVTLGWGASTSPNISGYNVYRGTASAGPFTKMNSSLITGMTYADSAVQAGQTYYYVATAVNTSGGESSYSTAVMAVIPTP